MKIVNEDGVSFGTKILSDDGKDIGNDLKVTDISIDLSVNEPVKAQIRCLVPKFSVEVLPENLIMIQDTSLLDATIASLETLMIHDMSKDVRNGLNNIHSLITAQLKLLEIS